MTVLTTSSPLRFASDSPSYLRRAAEYFKRQLVEKNIPAEAMRVVVNTQAGMPMIDVRVPDAAMKARVYYALCDLEGAIPFQDNTHVNFKVARVRVVVTPTASD